LYIRNLNKESESLGVGLGPEEASLESTSAVSVNCFPRINVLFVCSNAHTLINKMYTQMKSNTQ